MLPAALARAIEGDVEPFYDQLSRNSGLPGPRPNFDLARALSTISVRVVEVIPGKSVMGLEIPNEKRETVTLGEIIRSKTYEDVASPLALALGKDIGGLAVVAT